MQVRCSLRKSSGSLSGLAVVVALLVSVPVAFAIGANPTRSEYVAAVDPICKANTEANSQILKGVKRQVKRGKLAPAGRRFIRAATALGKTVRQIAAVPQPPADKAKLGKWVGYLKREQAYLRKIGKYLKAGKKGKAQHEAVQLNSNNSRANNTVVGFGFRECKIDSAKFL
jgi:hypothetical protein